MEQEQTHCKKHVKKKRKIRHEETHFVADKVKRNTYNSDENAHLWWQAALRYALKQHAPQSAWKDGVTVRLRT